MSAPFRLNEGLVLRPDCIIPWCCSPQEAAAIAGVAYEREPTPIVRFGKATLFGELIFDVSLQPQYRPRFSLLPIAEYASVRAAYEGVRDDLARSLESPGQYSEFQDRPSTEWRFGRAYIAVGVGNRHLDYFYCVAGHEDWRDTETDFTTPLSVKLANSALGVPVLGQMFGALHLRRYLRSRSGR